jgi:hypothetical protein
MVGRPDHGTARQVRDDPGSSARPDGPWGDRACERPVISRVHPIEGPCHRSPTCIAMRMMVAHTEAALTVTGRALHLGAQRDGRRVHVAVLSDVWPHPIDAPGGIDALIGEASPAVAYVHWTGRIAFRLVAEDWSRMLLDDPPVLARGRKAVRRQHRGERRLFLRAGWRPADACVGEAARRDVGVVTAEPGSGSSPQKSSIDAFIAEVLREGLQPALPEFLGAEWDDRLVQLRTMLEAFTTSLLVEIGSLDSRTGYIQARWVDELLEWRRSVTSSSTLTGDRRGTASQFAITPEESDHQGCQTTWLREDLPGDLDRGRLHPCRTRRGFGIEHARVATTAATRSPTPATMPSSVGRAALGRGFAIALNLVGRAAGGHRG